MKPFGLSRLATYSLTATALSLGAALLIATAVPAAAQAPLNPEQACRDDAFRLCNEFIPDRDKVGACLRRNGRSLSHDCRTIVLGGGGGARHPVGPHRGYHHPRTYKHHK